MSAPLKTTRTKWQGQAMSRMLKKQCGFEQVRRFFLRSAGNGHDGRKQGGTVGACAISTANYTGLWLNAKQSALMSF